MLYDRAFLGNPGTVKGLAWEYKDLFKADMWPLGLVAVLSMTLHFTLQQDASGAAQHDEKVSFRSKAFESHYYAYLLNLKKYKEEN
ncbi:hypothetical protein DACRYDRAFT_104370 [Dacryopinax primogenitus]|uniref:DUF6532 domain-containing protein n=1 Tax=Dacryopinax primogenitus (strain DJM 731) TaxID=1858805 RepID=M5GBR8_DACPD|nr:uncharacterized protein DACRYDRAFT_104370 [Dacryopinax primogenitus]EJU05880.1 hypothetical protein DACRYDRAFT_104370 [Dacryopinax primogenitus]